MASRIILIIGFAVVSFCRPIFADELSCPKNLTWRDAIYAQRIVQINGKTVKAETKRLSDAWTAEFDEHGNKAAIISLKRNAGNAPTAFTFGEPRPSPSEFSEMAMAVEPPMGDGSWSRMRRPCDIRDGERVDFSENDLEAYIRENSLGRPVFHGSIQRHGLDFSYEVMFEANGAEPAFSWQGKLQYGAIHEAFNLATDVQGWNLYRGGLFVKTVPIGEAVSVSTELDDK